MKSRLLVAICACVVTLITTSTNAALVDNGGGLIYDDVLDITWAQPDTQRTWDNANTWAAGQTLGGVSGWRLPYISVAAGAGPFTGSPVECSTASEVDCRDNELGYMFYQNLSGTASSPLFPTLESGGYWSGTEFDSFNAWTFGFSTGGQDNDGENNSGYAWAVRTGDVSATVVPVPAKDDIVVDFGADLGLWARMNDTSWLNLHTTLSPDRIAIADMDGTGQDDVIADFSSTVGGLYVKYNLGGWVFLHGGSSEAMAAGDLDGNGQDDLVVDFGAATGLWARMATAEGGVGKFGVRRARLTKCITGRLIVGRRAPAYGPVPVQVVLLSDSGYERQECHNSEVHEHPWNGKFWRAPWKDCFSQWARVQSRDFAPAGSIVTAIILHSCP